MLMIGVEHNLAHTHAHTRTPTDRTQNDTKIQNWHAYTTDSIFFVHGGVSERKVVDQRFGHNLTSNSIRVDLIITDFPFTRYLTPVCGGACACAVHTLTWRRRRRFFADRTRRWRW
jgi:hypothetical protein